MAILQQNIAQEVSRRLASPWTPSYCKRSSVCWRGNPPSWQRQGCKDVNSYQTCSLHVVTGLQDLAKPLPKETVKYYNNHLLFVTEQPKFEHEVAPSVLEHNATRYTAEQEWESDWNQHGLASRLTVEEYKAKKRQKVEKRISDQLRHSLNRVEIDRGKGIEDMTGISGEKAAKVKGSRFTHVEKLQYSPDDEAVAAQMQEAPKTETEEDIQQKRDEEISQLKKELQELTGRLERMHIDVKKFGAGQHQMDEKLSIVEKENEEKKEVFKVKKRTMDLLPDAESNVAKLQGLVDSSAQRLVSLANQWEKHRVPLITQYRDLKSLSENRESETQKRLEEIKRLREKMKELAGEAKAKEELYKQVLAEYEKMAKDINRAAYTKRILEIVGNIKKQKKDIDKVLIETKAVQKDINQLTGKLDRTFTVTDELVFQNAKKDESVRKVYKFLAALHENCNTVIRTVEETGVILREIRDLEDQIEQESKSKVLDNLEKITADYQEMKNENAALMAKYKKQQVS